MRESIILISTPLETLPAGGFIRDARVLPYFSKSFKARGTSTVIYIPVNSVVSAIKLAIKGGSDINEAFKLVAKDLANNIRRNSVEAPLLDEALAEVPSALKWELPSHATLSSRMLNKVLGFGYVYVHRIRSVEETLLKKFLKHVNSSFSRVGFVYSMNENIEHFISLAILVERLKTSAGIMLQLPLYAYPNIVSTSKQSLTVKIASWQLNSYLRGLFIAITQKGYLRLVQAVSPAPLVESYDLVDIARKYGVRISIPVPANAFDKEILAYRSLQEKEPVAVYFGRLSPGKGLYDLLHVWSRVERALPKAKLLLIGSFASGKVEEKFNELKLKLGLKNVEYLGYFKHREELYRQVSKAKVLIYPSHEDSFPLTMLEAVALGLVCVAYNIPALNYVYKGIPAVTLVDEGDVESLSKVAIRALEMSYDEYLKIQTASEVMEFLRIYSSWENVAMAELSNILHILNLS